jgi:hypothetical protein
MVFSPWLLASLVAFPAREEFACEEVLVICL